MSLVNWEKLDKEFEILCASLIDKKSENEKYVSISKVIEQSSKAVTMQTPAEEWDAYMLKNKGAMPSNMRNILETVTSASAPKLTAITRFAISLAEYWPDARTEIKELVSHNSSLVAERHKFRNQEFQNALKS